MAVTGCGNARTDGTLIALEDEGAGNCFGAEAIGTAQLFFVLGPTDGENYDFDYEWKSTEIGKNNAQCVWGGNFDCAINVALLTSPTEIISTQSFVITPPEPDDDDGVGDACTGDADGDGVENVNDNCPADAKTGQADLDIDGEGDACDDDDHRCSHNHCCPHHHGGHAGCWRSGTRCDRLR
jgi:hypothetical protein